MKQYHQKQARKPEPGACWIHGRLFIGETAAFRIGREIQRLFAPEKTALDELARCRSCKAKVLVTEISIRTLRENRRGYFGTCLACAIAQNEDKALPDYESGKGKNEGYNDEQSTNPTKKRKQ